MTVYPSGAPATLSDSHRKMLFKESDLAPGVVSERGTFTAWRGNDVPQAHGKLPVKPGLVFRIHTLDGGIFHRLRLDNPGRLPKYMQPKGHANRLDVHPRQHERIKQPGGMRYVTEGEKKVDAGVSHGLLMIGLSGVWNGQKDKNLIPDWDLLPVRGEKHSILFDSDIETNEHVQGAAERTARLLRECGAEVFITLLPPAPDGGKQGLDDFFAGGGTVKEIEMLTRPYDPAIVERVRLTRNQKLGAAALDLERRFWSAEWKGVGGHSARDVAVKLIEAAKRHGKIHADGIRVVKAQGPLALEAKVSGRTLWKSLNRLEEMGFLYRDNEGRKAEKSGAFVLRANVSQYGEKARAGGTPGEERVPGDLHLRAPRLMWARPKFTPKRGTIEGTHRVRNSKLPEARDGIERLGKIRGAVVDALDASGGTLTLTKLCEILHRKRARDVKRRILPMLEEAGILTVAGDTVTLTPDWLDRLEDARELGGERLAEAIARRKYEQKSRGYHARDKTPPAEEPPPLMGPERVAEIIAERAKAKLSPLAACVRDYLERNPRDACQPAGWIGSTLWALDLFEGKPTPPETRDAIKELGGEVYLKMKLNQSQGAA